MNLKIVNNFFIVICITITFQACKENKADFLHKKWKTVSLKNSTMDKQVKEMKDYIDTLGQNDPEVRAAINIDSAKLILQAQLTKSLNEQKLAEENTLMEFKSNGVCYTTSIEGTDSAMYSVEENLIKIDEAKLKGYGETMTFEILKLSADSLRLRVIDFGDTSVVTMVPAKG